MSSGIAEVTHTLVQPRQQSHSLERRGLGQIDMLRVSDLFYDMHIASPRALCPRR